MRDFLNFSVNNASLCDSYWSVVILLVGFPPLEVPNQFPQKIQSCKIFSAFGISLEGRWAFPLLYSRGCPGVQGKGESSDDGDEDLEHFALT